MRRRPSSKIKVGLDEALRVVQGDPAIIRNIKVTTHGAPSCGCVFCDLKLALYRDDHGFYHDGPEDMRIRCEVSHDA